MMDQVRQFAVGDRVSWAGAGCDGTILEFQKSGTMALVRWDHGGDSWFPTRGTNATQDVLYPVRRQAVIEADTFTRLAEIDAYADRAGIDRAEAIRQLVNAALSHQVGIW